MRQSGVSIQVVAAAFAAALAIASSGQTAPRLPGELV